MAVQAGCTDRGSNSQMLELGFALANVLSLIWGQIQPPDTATIQTTSSAPAADCSQW